MKSFSEFINENRRGINLAMPIEDHVECYDTYCLYAEAYTNHQVIIYWQCPEDLQEEFDQDILEMHIELWSGQCKQDDLINCIRKFHNENKDLLENYSKYLMYFRVQTHPMDYRDFVETKEYRDWQ